MRKTLVICALLVVAWLAAVSWPLIDLYRLADAVDARDPQAVIKRVDAPALRRSLIDQIMRAYIKLTGERIAPNSIATAAVVGIAEPVVLQMITPETLVMFIASGWPETVLSDKPAHAAGLSAATLGNAFQLFLDAEYGFARLTIGVPTKKPKAERFEIELHLSQWIWKLSSIKLPDKVATRIAQEIVNRRIR